ncbi:class II aldolase/adducin family protein [Ramlibacter rhizophilus]|uniref:Class II aldolase/adducin family protein n=1 Tax=Ramlibacter rhizophilus TaxID=1781167 RepID=A0A4Z0BFW4_9BURK|nr:class II aldolase/adducin family protein [Ramlibacter rhizophilus]TFY97343.1 class II aldolase/adducin family protein [Ramlibacter rhizophilus]
MNDTLEQQLDKLARACRILELEGHGDMSLGHLSLRDPQGRGFWMKRNRIGLGEVLGPQDFILLDFQGLQLAGDGGRHSEWPIHSQILQRRPDVQVVAHTHAFHTSVLSASAEPLLPFTLDGDYFAGIARHEDEVALIRLPEEGDALAAALGEHFVVLMANHGVTFCGTSIEHATCVGVFLEKAARAHLVGRSAGLRHTMPQEATRQRRHGQIMSAAHIEHSWEFFCRKLAWATARDGGKGAVFTA